jgi:hypothetical protein
MPAKIREEKDIVEQRRKSEARFESREQKAKLNRAKRRKSEGNKTCILRYSSLTTSAPTTSKAKARAWEYRA